MNKIILTAICCLLQITTYGNNTWKFAVVGDTHVPNAQTIKKIVPKLLKDEVEVVLFVGDLIQGGKDQDAEGMLKQLTQWKELIKPLSDAGIKILAVRGNHEADVQGDNIAPWKKLISPYLNLIYSHKNISFIGLDNYINGERTVDVKWLAKTLNAIDENSIIVPFGHEPAFSCNTFHPVCLDANIKNRNRFWSLLEISDVKYYFCGHTHQYNASLITHNGETIQQIVCGGGGGPLQPVQGGIKEAAGYTIEPIEIKSETGYLLVEVHDDKLSTHWISVYDEKAISGHNMQRIKPGKPRS